MPLYWTTTLIGLAALEWQVGGSPGELPLPLLFAAYLAIAHLRLSRW